MNRRSLMKYMGCLMASSIAGFGASLQAAPRSMTAGTFSFRLAQLYLPAFKEMAEKIEPGKVLADLIAKAVVDKYGAIDTRRLQVLAKEEGAIVVNNRYYSETEAQLYALAYLAHEN